MNYSDEAAQLESDRTLMRNDPIANTLTSNVKPEVTRVKISYAPNIKEEETTVT
jgi:hypothetical protein